MSNTLSYILDLKGNMASMMQKIGAESHNVTHGLEQVKSAASGLGNIFGMFGMGFGIYKVFDTIKEGVKDVQALREAEAQLKNTMQNMGVYSQDSYDKAIKGATDMSKGLKFTEIEIIGLQSQLRMVGKIGESEMNKLTMASADMATKFGMGLTEAGNSIAKAVNNPEMMTRLAMQLKIDPGIVDKIQKIAKAGDETRARLMLIDVVQQKVGGSAKAAFDADPLARFGKAMEGIRMSLGEIAVSVLKVLAPVIEKISVILQDAIKWLSDTFGSFFQEYGSKLMDFFNGISDAVSGLFDKIRQNSSSIMTVVSPLINIAKDVFNAFQELFNIIQTGNFTDIFQVFGDLLSNYIVPVISQLWNFIKDIVLKVVDFVSQSTLLKDLWLGIVNFVKALCTIVSWVIDGLKWLFDNVVMPILWGIEKAYRLISGRTPSKVEIVTKNPVSSIAPPTVPGTATTPAANGGISNLGGGTGGSAGRDTAKSIATGGTKTTNVTINLGSLIQGGFTVNASDIKEGASRMRDVILDELTRTLSMAQAI